MPKKGHGFVSSDHSDVVELLTQSQPTTPSKKEDEIPSKKRPKPMVDWTGQKFWK